MPRPNSLNQVPSFAHAKFSPAVIGNMSYSGLGLARALGRHGVPVIGFSPIGDIVGMNSRFLTPVICPNVSEQEEEFLDFLICLGNRLERKSVFFPTGDNTVLFLAKHAENLRDLYEFVVPDARLVRQVVGKESIFDLCIHHDIPTPRTEYPKSKEEMAEAMENIGFPCIIKPVLSPLWWTDEISAIVNHGKVVRLESLEHGLKVYDELAPLNSEFIVQEIIPGDDRNLFYFVFYADRQGKALVRFAGQKHRVTPTHFGSASYVKSIHDAQLEEISLKVVDAIGYIGLGGIEFKLDPRDNKFKLIEFNARFGLWDILATKCGIDLPWVAYLDALGLPVPELQDYEDGVIWISLARDLSALKEYRQEGILSIYQWLISLRGKRYGASFAWDDPLPGLREAFLFIKSRTTRAIKSGA